MAASVAEQRNGEFGCRVHDGAVRVEFGGRIDEAAQIDQALNSNEIPDLLMQREKRTSETQLGRFPGQGEISPGFEAARHYRPGRIESRQLPAYPRDTIVHNDKVISPTRIGTRWKRDAEGAQVRKDFFGAWLLHGHS
jgi:hypothetical protein